MVFALGLSDAHRMAMRPPRSIAPWLPVIALLCAGTALRLLWIAEVRPSPTHDATWYVACAKNLLVVTGLANPIAPPHIGRSVIRCFWALRTRFFLLATPCTDTSTLQSARSLYFACILQLSG
jgi:hypothetical protein